VANTNKRTAAPVELTGSGPDVAEVISAIGNDLALYTQNQNESGALLWTEFQQLRAASQLQTDAVIGNTAAVTQNTTALASSSGGGTSAGSVLKSVAKALGTGLGISPLINGLVGLFGGGGQETPAPLTTYTRPPAIDFEGEIVRSAPAETATPAETTPGSAVTQEAPPTLTQYARALLMDYGGATIRSAAAETADLAGTTPGSVGTSGRGAPAGQTPAAQTAGSGAAQITIQVQAMDSRSFLDHRDEIAQAVREAMLNSHSLNDVVSEL